MNNERRKAFFIGGVVSTFFQPLDSIDNRLVICSAATIASVVYLSLGLFVISANKGGEHG